MEGGGVKWHFANLKSSSEVLLKNDHFSLGGGGLNLKSSPKVLIENDIFSLGGGSSSLQSLTLSSDITLRFQYLRGGAKANLKSNLNVATLHFWGRGGGVANW